VANLEDWLQGEKEGVWQRRGVGVLPAFFLCRGGIALVDGAGLEMSVFGWVEGGEGFVGAKGEDCMFFDKDLVALAEKLA